ncbi:MAG: alpha/beta fold hydrolase [Isosphaeraceae bacterium]
MRLAAKWRTDWTWRTGSVPTRSSSLRVGGELVEVLRLGRGRPLVILPGLAGGWKLVAPLARRLAGQYQVFVTGLRGDREPRVGLDGGPGVPLDLAEYAEDVHQVIGALGLESPAVMGVSFGGAIALEYAVRYPHALSSLIVHGAEARFRTTIGSKIARRVLERYPLPTDSPFINQFFHLLYGKKPEPGPLVDFVVDRIWETSQAVMARRLAQLESFDVSDRLWRIEVPTLVLAGERDVIVPVSRQKALAEGIAGAQFEVLPDAGHIGFLTHRAEFLHGMRRHLSQIEATV